MDPELSQLKLEKLFEFQLVDKADGTHSVDGIATSEAVDKDKEIADYPGTLKAIKAWSDEAVKKTTGNGQETSLGNIRVQHDAQIIGGKMTGYDPDDAKKWIVIKTQPRNAIYDEYIQPGFVTAFSIAGGYESRKCNECGADIPGRGNYCAAECCRKQVVVRYVPNIAEISYVDNGCNPDACFTHVKANGGVELVKFADLRKQHEARKAADASTSNFEDRIENVLVKVGLIKEKKTKRVGGKDLHASDFAYVGDPDDTSTWKLPIHDAAHCRNALARFNQTQGIPAGEKAKVKAKIVARAKKFGIEVSDKSAKCVRASLLRIMAGTMIPPEGISDFKPFLEAEKVVSTVEEVLAKVAPETELFKGLYQVGQLAEILQGLQWIVASTEYERDYEGDESEVPDDLRVVLEDLVPVFVAMASEEAHELLQKPNNKTANGGQGGNTMSKLSADLLKAAQDLWKKAASHFSKMSKAHSGLSKCMGKAAGHHDGLSELYGGDKAVGKKAAKHHDGLAKVHASKSDHHDDLASHCVNCGKAMADKALEPELLKLTESADFKKAPLLDQLEKVADLLIEKASGCAAHFGKMAKGHARCAKGHDMVSDGHEAIHKAAIALGDAEDEIEMGGTEEDDSRAHPGGDSEKAQKIADLEKQIKELKGEGVDPLTKVLDAVKALEGKITAQGETVAQVKKDVDEKLSKLEPGPGEARKLALDDKHTVDDKGNKKNGDGEEKSPLAINKETASKGRGVFA